MVSVGDTAVSLHILGCKKGGGILGYSKLTVPSPDQIFILGGGGERGGGRGGWNFAKNRVFLAKSAKKSPSYCITDSYHTLREWRLD